MAKIVPHYNPEVIVAYDVDDTLVRFEDEVLIEHSAHIESLKIHWYRGHHVILWSAGGQKWAEYIAKRLNLTDFVHEIKAKPRWYVDDKQANDWMERYYIAEKGFNNGYSVGASKEATGSNKDGSSVPSIACRGSSVVYPLPEIQGYGCTITGRAS